MIAFLLLLISIAAGGFGFLVLMHATTVFQEMEGMVMFVVAAVLLSGAFIVNSVDVARRKVVKAIGQLSKKLDHGRTTAGIAPPAWPTIVA